MARRTNEQLENRTTVTAKVKWIKVTKSDPHFPTFDDSFFFMLQENNETRYLYFNLADETSGWVYTLVSGLLTEKDVVVEIDEEDNKRRFTYAEAWWNAGGLGQIPMCIQPVDCLLATNVGTP